MRIAIDIETNLAHDRIWLVKTLDIDSGEEKTWYEASPLRDWLRGCTLLVAHNGIGFDFPVLTKLWGIKMTMKTWDSLVVSRLLDPSRENGHSLEAWGQTLGQPKLSYPKVWAWMMDRKEEYKGECFDKALMPLLEKYCGDDCKTLRVLFLHLERELKAKGFSEESVELEHEVAYILKEQEENGFELDVVHATVLLADWKGRLSALAERAQELYPPVVTKRFHKTTGKPLKDSVQTFNLGSRLQVVEKLKALGWKPTKKTDLGTPILDEGVLDEILKDAEGTLKELSELVKEYLLIQKRISQVESWIEALGKDGRVHGRVITNGAVTGRMTHSGPNMAQVPNSDALYGPECRQCWKASEGWSLVGADASGLELRMLAHYMQDEKYTEAVINGKSSDGTDIHTINQKAAGLETRSQAKTFIYAFLYGAGPAKIGSIVGGSAKEGQKLIDSFLAKTPALAALKRKLKRYCEKGYVPGLDGRLIWIRSDHAALNSLLQGAGAIVMKKALVIFYNKVKASEWPVRLVANVHDEWQMEVRPGYEDIVGQAAVDSIKEAGEHFKLRCPLAGEYKAGKTWKDTH